MNMKIQAVFSSLRCVFCICYDSMMAMYITFNGMEQLKRLSKRLSASRLHKTEEKRRQAKECGWEKFPCFVVILGRLLFLLTSVVNYVVKWKFYLCFVWRRNRNISLGLKQIVVSISLKEETKLILQTHDN